MIIVPTYIYTKPPPSSLEVCIHNIEKFDWKITTDFNETNFYKEMLNFTLSKSENSKIIWLFEGFSGILREMTE